MELNFPIPEYVSSLVSSSLSGYKSLLETLSNLLETTVLLTNSMFEVMWITNNEINISIDYLESFCPIGSEEYPFKRCFFKIDDKEYVGLCYPILINQSSTNYLIVLSKDTIIDTAKRYEDIISYAAKLIEIEFKKNETILLERRKIKDVFLYDLIYGNIKKEEEIFTYGQLWKWDFQHSHIVATFSLNDFDFFSDDPKSMELINYGITKILEENEKNAITLVKKNEVVLIYLFQPQEDMEKTFELYMDHIKNYLSKYPFYSRLGIGIGKKRSHAIKIYKTYQEAKISYELGTILHLPLAKFNELGLEKILFNHDTQELREFFEQILGKLLKEDELHNLQLLQTLEEFVSNQFDINKTAESMFIHKNTLRYRLKKIEEVLQVKLSDMDIRLNITAALKIKQLGKLK